MISKKQLLEKINTMIATVNEAHLAHTKEYKDECWRIVDRVLDEINKAIDDHYDSKCQAQPL